MARRVDVCVYGVGDVPRFGAATPPTASGLVWAISQDGNYVDLEGADLTGEVHIKTVEESNITSVDFYVDGAFVNSESAAPYHLDNTATWAYNTAVLSNGAHTFSATLNYQGGGTETVSAEASTTNEAAPSGSNVLEADLASVPLHQSLSQSEIQSVFAAATRFTVGGVGTADSYVADGSSGSIAPTYDGSKGRVLAFVHPANQHYAGTWNSEIIFGPGSSNGGGGYDYVQLVYEFYLSGWQISNKALGKLPGLSMVPPGGHPDMRDPYESPAHCVFNIQDGEGASFRHTTHDGQFTGYYYTTQKPNDQCGIKTWPRGSGYADGAAEHVDVGGAGYREKWQNGGWVSGSRWESGVARVQSRVWHEVRQVVRVSTNEVWEYLDGELQSYIAGGPASLRASGNYGETLVNGVRFDVYNGSYSGGGVDGGQTAHPSGAPGCNVSHHQSSDTWTLIANFRVEQLT